jgi:uncharacterized membrane protein (DUF2068 family)
MKNQKHFLASKLNWMGIITIIIAVLQFVESYDVNGLTDVKAWVTFVTGILIIVFRTWATTTEIKK